MIRVENLTRRFGRTAAVDGVSLEIGAGEAVALWGPNGAGKTTIIRCVLGLLRFRGRITVAGLDVRRRGKRTRRLIGYVPQELGIYDDLRLTEAVRFFARLKGVSPVRAADTLDSVGLAGNEAKRVRELSGGMRQRLALALAMLGDPPVLVLDEVTASLDACGRDEFISLLAGLRGEGRAMLFASHRIEEVTALATRVAMLDRGRLTGQVAPRELLSATGAAAVLHLHLPADAANHARAVLAERGFDARVNGVGVVVPVSATDKAAPFRILAEGRITVADFDLLPADGSLGRRTP